MKYVYGLDRNNNYPLIRDTFFNHGKVILFQYQKKKMMTQIIPPR